MKNGYRVNSQASGLVQKAAYSVEWGVGDGHRVRGSGVVQGTVTMVTRGYIWLYRQCNVNFNAVNLKI